MYVNYHTSYSIELKIISFFDSLFFVLSSIFFSSSFLLAML